MRGIQWTIEEERELRQLLEKGVPVTAIAKKLDKTPEAVRVKLGRLGLQLVVVANKKSRSTTTTIAIPEELPTVEEALKVLAGALKALEKPGISLSEIQRLRSIITGAKNYQGLFADYVDYRGIEIELTRLADALQEMRVAYEKLLKQTQSSPSKRDMEQPA